jgi:hypothetical protein
VVATRYTLWMIRRQQSEAVRRREKQSTRIIRKQTGRPNPGSRTQRICQIFPSRAYTNRDLVSNLPLAVADRLHDDTRDPAGTIPAQRPQAPMVPAAALDAVLVPQGVGLVLATQRLKLLRSGSWRDACPLSATRRSRADHLSRRASARREVAPYAPSCLVCGRSTRT